LVTKDTEPIVRSIPGCKRKRDLDDVLDVDAGAVSFCHDAHVPKLLALSPGTDVTKTDIYKQGELILQDKASCFPAYLLLGDESKEKIGDVLDGCAAPGNKTTHLAAVMGETGSRGKVFACERDSTRSKTLRIMVDKAGAGMVDVLARQDFLALDPQDVRFGKVTHLLLDPSCSGSGILRREDIPKLALPDDPRTSTKATTNTQPKKRKREDAEEKGSEEMVAEVKAELAPTDEEAPIAVNEERLQKLSSLQTRIVEHAMKFSAARRLTYSTCSIHEQENEVVVSRLLASQVAQTRGWKILPRSQQVDGMKRWKHRGVRSKLDDSSDENKLTEEESDACIRCNPDDEEGTMGFFVCAFARDVDSEETPYNNGNSDRISGNDGSSDEGESWEGFD